MFKKKKGFFSKMFRKANISSGVAITIISIVAIGIILYGASHFSKAYNDGKFLSELPHIKTSAELLEKARSYDYDYVGYNNSKSVNDMIIQIKNATPNVGIGGSTNNGGNTNSSTNNNGNRIVIYNSDVSGSGNLTQNDNDIVKKTKAYLIFLKNRRFSEELAGLYKYYGYISGYNVYNVKTNNYFTPLTLGNGGSDGICNNNSDNYGLTTGNNDTYSKIFYLDNTEDPDCVYLALHDKDNFASGVEFVLNSDLDFSRANMKYNILNDNLDLSGYNSTGNTFLPIGGYDSDSAGGNTEFNATFSGNNYKITIGNISYPDNDYVGFFGYIGTNGKISDLKLKVGNVSGSKHVGGFVGVNFGTIKNSSAVVNNSVKGNDRIGGFVGDNGYGTISNSSVVVNSVSGNLGVGGFAGENVNGTIENSSVVVNTVSGDSNGIGGFVGGNWGIITNSSVVVNSISGNNSHNVGGFVGYNDENGKIQNSSVVVNIVNGNNQIGGFVGGNNSGIINNSSTIVNSVSGSSDVVGGFVGYNYNGTIESSLAVVNNVNGSSDIGGFVGYNNSGTYTDDVARILNLDNNSDVSAGYYKNNNNQTSSTSVSKEQFFFEDPNGNNNGLEYDGNNLTITVPADKTFNAGNFPSVFSSNNNNWGQNYILNNLNNYWTNW